MADVMMTAMPFAGHVAPVLRAAQALVGAGHRVRAYVGASYTDAFASVGATPVPWQRAPDFDEHDLAATFPAIGRRGPLGVLTNLEHVFVRSGVGQVADLAAEHARRPWDVLVGDSLSLGGALASELVGVPWASLSVVPLTIPSRDLPPPGVPVVPGHGPVGRARDAVLRGAATALTGRLRRALAETRAAAGLPPDSRRWEETLSPYLVLALGIPGLESPRSDLPAHVHFIGAFPGGTRPTARPPWWDEVMSAGRPVVHVTQGTFNIDPDELIRPTLEGLAGRDVSLVVATGTPGQDTLPFPAPANARVAGMLPYPDLLPRTDVMVTNGGWGGVLTALAHGVPLVVAGGELDKPVIAAMVARSGAGIDLRTGRPDARTVDHAVGRVLHEPAFRHHAARLAAQLAEHDTAAEVVDLVGRLLTTGAPVLRARDPWADRDG